MGAGGGEREVGEAAEREAGGAHPIVERAVHRVAPRLREAALVQHRRHVGTRDAEVDAEDAHHRLAGVVEVAGHPLARHVEPVGRQRRRRASRDGEETQHDGVRDAFEPVEQPAEAGDHERRLLEAGLLQAAHHGVGDGGAHVGVEVEVLHEEHGAVGRVHHRRHRGALVGGALRVDASGGETEDVDARQLQRGDGRARVVGLLHLQREGPGRHGDALRRVSPHPDPHVVRAYGTCQ